MATKQCVAIVGAGPSGLCSAKYAINNRIIPTVFEKESEIGGLWKSNSGHVWNNMTTNLSKYSCMFSDFLHYKSTPLFPSVTDIQKYLYDYCIYYDILKFIKFQCKITHIKQNSAKKYIVSWFDIQHNKHYHKIFDFVIIASGIFSTPYIPSLFTSKNINNSFKGTILHSSQYFSLQKLLKTVMKNKNTETLNVSIIGNSFSAYEIATDIITSSINDKINKNIKLTHIIIRAHWLLSRYQTFNNKQLPLDLVFYLRDINKGNFHEIKIKTETEYIQSNLYLKDISLQNIFDKNNKLNKNAKQILFDINNKNPSNVAICNENYLNYLDDNKIRLMNGKIVKLSNNMLNVMNKYSKTMEFIQCDVLILCLGYKCNLSYLNKNILNIIQYDGDNRFQPLLLYKTVFHPLLSNIGFIGMYRGPYFTVIELQSRWCIYVFRKKCKLPNINIMNNNIIEEYNIRNQQPRPQFPHGDFIEFAESISQEMDISPYQYKSLIKNKYPMLYEKIFKMPIIPSMYGLIGTFNIDSKTFQKAMSAINDVYKLMYDNKAKL